MTMTVIRPSEPGAATIQDEWPSGEFIATRPNEAPSESQLKQTNQTQGRVSDVFVGSLFDDRLRMVEPIHVEVEQEGDDYIAKCDKFNEFGYGEDVFSAIDDLRITLAELYWSLKHKERTLGKELAALFMDLSQVIKQEA